MIDKEMALEIGKKILALEHYRAVMTAILDNIKLPDGSRLDWRPLLKEDMPTLLSSPVSHQKYAELQQAIDAESGHSSALERLYQHFLV
jgi:hypothetical protein